MQARSPPAPPVAPVSKKQKLDVSLSIDCPHMTLMLHSFITTKDGQQSSILLTNSPKTNEDSSIEDGWGLARKDAHGAMTQMSENRTIQIEGSTIWGHLALLRGLDYCAR